MAGRGRSSTCRRSSGCSGCSCWWARSATSCCHAAGTWRRSPQRPASALPCCSAGVWRRQRWHWRPARSPAIASTARLRRRSCSTPRSTPSRWRRVGRCCGVDILPKAIMVAIAPLVLVVTERSVALAVLLPLPMIGVHLACKAAIDAEANRAAADAAVAAARVIAAEQARLAQAEQAVARRLQESERLKENLLATVSHELRTPLAGVLGAIATLDQRGHLLTPELQGEFIAMAARQGRRLRELIEDLLLAATLEQVPSERLPAPPVDVSDLARQACEVARRADPTQPIVVSLDGSLPVRAAPDAVLQVLTNLLDNATRHSPEGVAIRLEARPQGAHALIAIQDGGPGVPLAERERIFERFIRLDEKGSSRRGGGVGLGLYVARRLARAQGGDLRVAEPVGVEGGARFELLLPLAGEPEPAADLGPVGLLPAREVAREVVGQGQQAGQASVGEALPPAAQA